jgi:cholesterol oxidase
MLPSAIPVDRASTWLSRDLVELVEELNLRTDALSCESQPHFDVVIVGSGYGGSVVLRELAGYGHSDRPLRIAMLERGNEYLRGSFPTRLSDLAGHVRFSTANSPHVRGETTGLFDIRVGPDVSMLLGSGLGGGSLINAGVVEAPLSSVFAERRWPTDIRKDEDLPRALAEMQRVLQATPAGVIPQREASMNSLAGKIKSTAPFITVAQVPDPARGINACNQCGDCATGCNVGAKLSLDVTLLAEAASRHDRDSLRIVTGATVQTFVQVAGGYDLELLHTDTSIRRRQVAPYRMRTKRLVIAAGTMGSTELLMRAAADGLMLSTDRLGQRFSTNGDMISAIYGTQAETKGSAKDGTALAGRAVGPTITRMIDRRAGSGLGRNADVNDQFVLQDLAVPAALRKVFEEVATTGALLQSLTKFDHSTSTFDTSGSGSNDPAGIDQSRIDKSFVVALIGRDDANGRLHLPNGASKSAAGSLSVRWPKLKTDPRHDAYQAALEAMVSDGHKGAIAIPNPGWRPLPSAIEDMFGSVRGAAVTVHPLGGCVMADDGSQGVVNSLGQVFKSGEGTAVHSDLIVLDGSIVPTSLGINPSLTIATLAQRAIQKLRDESWLLKPVARDARPISPRPPFRVIVAPEPEASTDLELNERMTGTADLDVDGVSKTCTVVLQLRFSPTSAEELTSATSDRSLRLDEKRSSISIFEKEPARSEVLKIDPKGTPVAAEPARRLILHAPLTGTMKVFSRTQSGIVGRTARGICTWLINRGFRDIAGKLPAVSKHGEAAHANGTLALILPALRLASHATNKRLLSYDLEIGSPTIIDSVTMAWRGQRIGAVKTLVYEVAGNPISQLTRAKLTTIPVVAGMRFHPDFIVDLPYFAETGVPLFRIARQTNQPRALLDALSVSLYVLRAMLPLHAWSLRLPDVPSVLGSSCSTLTSAAQRDAAYGPSSRLPGKLGGIEPEVFSIPTPDGAHFQLTRYVPRDGTASDEPPVMAIHGYSASGTTFAHDLLPSGGLAGYLRARGREVWVLDMRSSAGMNSAQRDWTFEQMACQDIPVAVAHIVRVTKQQKIDVVAHCMGAAMLSLGLFGDWTHKQPFDSAPTERAALKNRIRRLVLSQVGPSVVMSPANTARAYIISWIRHYAKLGKFEFRNLHPTAASQMLDRLLNVVPYPRSDFFRENPLLPPWKATEWVGVRHRMDSLYGVTFKLANMSDEVLDEIDSFFGPLSLQTASQVITFARQRLVTDRSGDGSFMSPEKMSALIGVPVLCLHSDENGLADISTREHLMELLQAAGVVGTSIALRGMGHQDSLIGKRAEEVFGHIHEFIRGATS